MLKTLYQNKWTTITLALVLVFAVLTIANYFYSDQNPGGNDFLVHWLGTRSFFKTGESPYSDETAIKIQTMVYGRAAQEGEHELRVAYPLYSVMLFAPFAIFQNYTFARALWMSVLELSLFGIVFFTCKLLFWKPKTWILGILVIFAFLSYHGMRPLINGNAVIVITLFIVLALMALRDRHDEVAGVLLAVMTIKPQNVVVFIAFIFFWAIINKRKKVITWFLGTMVLLFGFAFLLIPNWIVQNLREVMRYPSYNPDGSVGAVLQTAWGAIGDRLSIVLTFILLVGMFLEWWLARRGTTRQFLWVSFLTIAVSQWIGIQTDPGNFILLYPGVIFCFYLISERWKEKANIFLAFFTAITTIGVWVIFLVTLERNYQPIQSPVMFFPMPIIAFCLLYWVRWWVSNVDRLEMNKRTLGL